VSRGCRLPARVLESVACGPHDSLFHRVRALGGPVVSCWPGGFRVSLLVLKAAVGLFKLDARLVEAQGAAKRVVPAAHIAQTKVPKPPHRSAPAANRTFIFSVYADRGRVVKADVPCSLGGG
jgi:hypothetical protein